MEHNAAIDAIAQVIQLAVAPVFLLTGISGILGVLSTRLSRITDRARLLERRKSGAQTDEQRTLLHAETDLLWRRIRIINRAIRLAVAAALMICLVVVSLFVGDLAYFDAGFVIALFFVAAMLLLIAALVLLLVEVTLSTRKMQQGLETLLIETSS